MVSEGPLLFARGNRFAGTMLREAVIVVRPPGKHDELLVCTRLQKRSFARSGVLCINVGALTDGGAN